MHNFCNCFIGTYNINLLIKFQIFFLCVVKILYSYILSVCAYLTMKRKFFFNAVAVALCGMELSYGGIFRRGNARG